MRSMVFTHSTPSVARELASLFHLSARRRPPPNRKRPSGVWELSQFRGGCFVGISFVKVRTQRHIFSRKRRQAFIQNQLVEARICDSPEQGK